MKRGASRCMEENRGVTGSMYSGVSVCTGERKGLNVESVGNKVP